MSTNDARPHLSASRVEYEPPALFDTGLLWYINTTCLHPHGLAMSVSLTEVGMTWAIHAAPDGVVIFDEETAKEKAAAVRRLFALARDCGTAPAGAVNHWDNAPASCDCPPDDLACTCPRRGDGKS